MVSLLSPGDKVEDRGQEQSSTIAVPAEGDSGREAFLASFPGLDPWFQRRWTLPEVEARGPSFRRRFSWAMNIGTQAGREEGGLAWWELGVLNVLADRSGNGRTINGWTHKRLAAWIGCSSRSVKRWLDGLRVRGWVEWCHNQHRDSSGGIRQLANSYVLLIPEWVQAKIDDKGNSSGGGAKRRKQPPTATPRSSSKSRVGALPVPPPVPEVEPSTGDTRIPVEAKAIAPRGLAAARAKLGSKGPKHPPP